MATYVITAIGDGGSVDSTPFEGTHKEAVALADSIYREKPSSIIGFHVKCDVCEEYHPAYMQCLDCHC